MLQTFFHPVILFLHQNPHSAGLITFIIAFGEALAVVGTIIPGSVTMTAIGALIGSRVIPAYSTMIWAMCGAVAGDTLSYLIGHHFKKRIHKIWPFTKHPKWLEKGEIFFKNHGGKSVIIGRFFGPARSMVPLVAGSLNMPIGRFLLAAVPSASVWAIGYMIPGILLGAISLELPPGLALKFIITTLIIIALCVVIAWVIKLCFQQISERIEQMSVRLWNYFQEKKQLHWIVRLLTDPRHPKNNRQLILAVYVIIFVALFLILFLNVMTHSPIIDINHPIYHLLTSARDKVLDYIFLTVTIFGTPVVMVINGIIILFWLLLKRYFRTAFHWLALLILGSGAAQFFKVIYFNARPGYLLHGPTTSSFPSGHTLMTTVIIGFAAVLIAQELKKDTKKIPYIIAAWIIGMVAFSRIFLGAHWFTDVIGAIILGIAIILTVTISYRRSNMPKINHKQFFITLILTLLLTTTIDSVVYLKKLHYDYQLFWPDQTITLTTWEQRTTPLLPLYRDNSAGHAVEAFNIEWLGNIKKIKSDLIQQGWIDHQPNWTTKGIISRLSTNKTNHSLPLLPQLYHHRPPILLMTKDLDHEQSIILRLWQSDINIENSDEPLWIGTVNYHNPPFELLTPHKHFTMQKLFFGATKDFTLYLKNYQWTELIYPIDERPKHMQRVQWDGKLLLIK